MFSEFSTLSTIVTIVLVLAFIILVLYNFIMLKVLKKAKAPRMNSLIGKIEATMIESMSINDEIKTIEHDQGRAGVVAYVLNKIEDKLQESSYLNNTEKIILKAINLDIVAEFIVNQLERTGVLTINVDDKTELDETVDTIEDYIETPLELAEEIKETTDGVGDDTEDLNELIDHIVDEVEDHSSDIKDIVDKAIETIDNSIDKKKKNK